MLNKSFLLKSPLVLLVFSSFVFSSCLRKILTSGDSYYNSHTNVGKASRHAPSGKCYAWVKIDSKKHLQKKAYGIKYSEKVNKNEKKVFD